jgi:ABC-type multidrug transport system ATPase subunit
LIGAGKTTLLNFLSNKDVSANLERKGEVKINGINSKDVDIGAITAFV